MGQHRVVPAPGGGIARGGNADFRQADYLAPISEIAAASPHAEKLIAFEFSTCMSPNAEWGSSERLLHRYIEALAMHKSKIAFPSVR